MIRFVLPLILLLLSSAVALAQTPYYQGKTITFIVGSGAGTAYDMYSRLLANHIGKHIAGNPSRGHAEYAGRGRHRRGKFCLWSGEA